MSADVVSLKEARVDRDARVRARIEETIAASTARFGTEMQARMEWTFMPGEKRGDVAEYLASEITHRYSPIAKQFKALFDVISLYVAAAAERGEDLGMAVLKALTVAMTDERYIGIAAHIAREQVIAAKDGMTAEIAQSIRSSSPSCVRNRSAAALRRASTLPALGSSSTTRGCERNELRRAHIMRTGLRLRARGAPALRADLSDDVSP